MKAMPRTCSAAVCALLCAAFPLLADPAMPAGFSVDFRDASGLTWRETGRLAMPLAEAIAQLRQSLEAQGYRLRHDIFDKSRPDRHLFLWLKADEEVTLLAWTIDARTTGVSWGVSRPAPAPAATLLPDKRTPKETPP